MNDQLILFIILTVCIAVCLAIYLAWPLTVGILHGVLGAGYTAGRQRAARRDRVKDLRAHPRSNSERNVIQCLEQLTGHKFPTVYPGWLTWGGKQLELDGYNRDLCIALEFSGPLHTKWTPGNEDYREYIERVVRDAVKRKVCREEGVDLIIIDSSLPRVHWRDYLESRLYDISASRVDPRGKCKKLKVRERPVQYIPAQTAEPYRNPHLEKELGLVDYIESAL